MTKQIYFVVYFDTDDNGIAIDDTRAEAVFGGEDVWDEETQEWGGMYDHAHEFEQARQALLDLVSKTWKQA